MKIYMWLSHPMSAINGIAIVEVESEEKAEFESFLSLIDGDTVGHFGVQIELLSTDTPPELYYDKRLQRMWPRTQFGFDRAGILTRSKRYFLVHVHRD